MIEIWWEKLVATNLSLTMIINEIIAFPVFVQSQNYDIINSMLNTTRRQISVGGLVCVNYNSFLQE